MKFQSTHLPDDEEYRQKEGLALNADVDIRILVLSNETVGRWIRVG